MDNFMAALTLLDNLRRSQLRVVTRSEFILSTSVVLALANYAERPLLDTSPSTPVSSASIPRPEATPPRQEPFVSPQRRPLIQNGAPPSVDELEGLIRSLRERQPPQVNPPQGFNFHDGARYSFLRGISVALTSGSLEEGALACENSLYHSLPRPLRPQAPHSVARPQPEIVVPIREVHVNPGPRISVGTRPGTSGTSGVNQARRASTPLRQAVPLSNLSMSTIAASPPHLHPEPEVVDISSDSDPDLDTMHEYDPTWVGGNTLDSDFTIDSPPRKRRRADRRKSRPERMVQVPCPTCGRLVSKQNMPRHKKDFRH